MFRKFLSILVLAVVLLTATLISGADRALAAGPFIVTSNVDSPDAAPGDGKCKAVVKGCTLRAAIEEANANADSDTIYLKPVTEYKLTLGALEILHNVTILGGHMQNTVISGNGASTNDRTLRIAPGASVAMSDLVILGGIKDDGAGIYNQGTLTLARTNITENYATNNGGSIYNAGSLLLADSMVSDSSAGKRGGGIYNTGTLAVYNSTFFNTEATDEHGGAIFHASGPTVQLVNSTLTGNRAGLSGGAIYSSANLEAYNVTIVGNKANLKSSNGDGGGIFSNAGSFTLRNTLIGDNLVEAGIIDTNDDCGGPVTASHKSLVESDHTCTIVDPNNYIVTGLQPHLKSLDANGGWTLTRSFNDDSAGVDYGEQGVCDGPGSNNLLYDQRGYARLSDGNNNGTANCDLGALEFGSPDPCPAKPGKPNVTAPSAGASSKKRVWLMLWAPTDCAMSYTVTIRQDSQSGAVVQTEKFNSGNHFITKKLARHHTYYAQLKACNAHGCGKTKTVMFKVN